MSLIMMTCSLCNKNLAWDDRYYKSMPVHYCETTGGQRLCDGKKQWIPEKVKEINGK